MWTIHRVQPVSGIIATTTTPVPWKLIHSLTGKISISRVERSSVFRLMVSQLG